MVLLAQLHTLLIYTSPNFKAQTQVSEFGLIGTTRGVWEYPSIFPLPVNGNKTYIKQITQIGLNPGGPPSTTGSGVQYVMGTFNGTVFVADTISSGAITF